MRPRTVETLSRVAASDEVDQRFKAIWLYCMIDHQIGTLPGGPCRDCIVRYAKNGPPDGKWNR